MGRPPVHYYTLPLPYYTGSALNPLSFLALTESETCPSLSARISLFTGRFRIAPSSPAPESTAEIGPDPRRATAMSFAIVGGEVTRVGRHTQQLRGNWA